MPSDLREQLQSSLGAAYTLERELGGAGMSRVFVATETALGRRVVVKVLPPETAAGVSIDRFKREILLAARLQHPHIVPLLSAGDAAGLPYFTMPFVEGDSLRARLTRHGELPVAEGTRLLREIAAALDYAHQHGIVHRDIKPDNVLLSGGSAIVTDFGVAKALSASSNAEGSGVTSQGIALGTPAYMAPEQATADPAVDHRADIYAFGVLAYELLSGQPPFTGRTPAHLLAAHVTEAPESLGRRRTALSPALSGLVMRCLEKRPADRPQSAAEIVHALDDLTTPSGGMQPTTARRAAKPTARSDAPRGVRHRFGLGIGFAAAAAIAGVAIVGWIATRGAAAPDADSAATRTIAVLPFASGDTASEYFAEGITDELHGVLARTEGLTVKARSVRSQFQGREDDFAAVADRLGIGMLVVGSVRRAGAKVRITAELMRAADNSTIWSQSFAGDEAGLFALQDSVARAIAGVLRGRVEETHSSRPDLAGTKSVEAYDIFLQGKFLLDKRGEKSIRQSIPLFERAIATDSTFARAYAALATALSVLPDWSSTTTDSVRESIRLATDKALALDSSLVDAQLARGLLLVDWPYRWAESEHVLRRAIHLAPSSAIAHKYLGDLLSYVGRHDEAIAELQIAARLDPFMANAWFGLAMTQMAARQFDAAITNFLHALSIDDGFVFAKENLALAFLLSGDVDSARRELGAEPDTSVASWELSLHAFVWARTGQRARAQSVARTFERSARSSPRLPAGAGLVFLGLGDSVRALDWFIRAADAHERPFYFGSPEFDPIRTLPRYPELLRKLNLHDQPVAKLKAGGRS